MHKGLLFLFIFISTSLLAQVRLENPEMYIGATGGATGSMVSFSPTVKQTYILGTNAGIVFRYIAEKNVGMQAELNFSQRGWNEKDSVFSRQLNYVELPFMTHIYIGTKNRVFFNFGPKVSYLISDKVIKNGTKGSTLVQEATNVQNRIDYGICGGLGILFKIKKNILQLDTRVYYSLSDIYSNDKRDFFANSNNLNLSLNLAWLIQVK